MKQLILHGPRDLRIEEKPSPGDQLGPKQILVETEVTAMSVGTERNMYTYVDPHWFAVAIGSHPTSIGYNNVGRVKQVGSQVQRFRVGDRVYTLAPHMSEYVAEQDGVIVKVPEKVNPEEAAHAHLLSLGLHALRRGSFVVGQNVAVIGLGVIGLCTVALAKALGARVLAVGHNAPRLDAARELGADLALNSGDEGFRQKAEVFGDEVGIDLAIVVTNRWSALKDACEIVRDGGTVSFIGHPGVGEGLPDFNPFDPAWFYQKQITIVSVSFVPETDYPPQDVRWSLNRNYRYIFDLMEQGRLQLAPMITHRYSYTEAKEAYERVAKGDKDVMGLVFKWL